MWGRCWNQWGILLILALLMLGMFIANPRFLTAANLLNILKQSAPLALISLGLLVVLVTSSVDLTVGVFIGLSGALLAGLSLSVGSLPAVVIVIAVALLLGLINGYLTTRGENLSVIVTLAVMIAIQGVTLIYTNGQPIIEFPSELRVLGAGKLFGLPVPAVLIALVALVVHVVLTRTVFGRELFAIGSNREAARLCGININCRIIQAFMISAVLSATAGWVVIGRVFSAQPTAGVGEEFSAIGAVLIGGASLNGGRGRVIGVVAGVSFWASSRMASTFWG